MKFLSKILGLCWCLSAASAGASCLTSDRLTGVNLAGAEFGKVPGRLNYDYIYPTRQELEALAEFGGNTLRLPIRWERIRPAADGLLNDSELQQIAATYETAKELGLCMIIDMHNYARYYGVSLRGNAALKSSFTDTWLQLAAALPDTRHVAFGLMNEPVNMPVSEWAQLAQGTVLELRRQNHGHLILVAGGRWSGAHDWFGGYGEEVNAVAFANFADPLDNYALEVHQYADSDYSGTHQECREAEIFGRIFSKIGDWALAHDQPLFLGEFGVAGNQICLNTLGAFLSLTSAAPWRGWTYWAAGRWWGNYPMAVSLTSMSDSPQWAILQPFLAEDRAWTEPDIEGSYVSADGDIGFEVPVPADWLRLKASLVAMPGLSDVQMDARGVISVMSNGVPMRGRSGFRVHRGAPALAQPDRVVFQPAGDINGDGRADFTMIYPNGDRQLLLIYPALD